MKCPSQQSLFSEIPAGEPLMESEQMVKMSHPDLPEGQDIEVDEGAVPIHRQSGWQTAGEQPKDTSKTSPSGGPVKAKE